MWHSGQINDTCGARPVTRDAGAIRVRLWAIAGVYA
jgi:hypothetical protein